GCERGAGAFARAICRLACGCFPRPGFLPLAPRGSPTKVRPAPSFSWCLRIRIRTSATAVRTRRPKFVRHRWGEVQAGEVGGDFGEGIGRKHGGVLRWVGCLGDDTAIVPRLGSLSSGPRSAPPKAPPSGGFELRLICERRDQVYFHLGHFVLRWDAARRSSR